MIEDLYLLEKILNINDTLMIINYSDPNDTWLYRNILGEDVLIQI